MSGSMQHGLGRIHRPDARDAGFPMEAHAPSPAAKLPATVEYALGPQLDQGQMPMCVGYGWRDWLSAGTVVNTGGPAPDAIYHAAQQLDRMPLPHDGSTVRAGAQVLQGLGYLSSYVWASDAATIARFMLGGGGPVVLGTAWTDAMFTPDVHGVVVPHGAVAGGHCYLAVGYNVRHHLFHCQNSWGSAWGDHGAFYITAASLNRLLKQQGEACAAAELQEAA